MRQVMGRVGMAMVGLVAVGGCGLLNGEAVPPPTTFIPPIQPVVSTTTTTTLAPTTTVPLPLIYEFPFRDVDVSYGDTHHDYPATDVFGCGATVVAPIWGTVSEVRTADLWDPATDNPAHRGGFYVTLLGGDGVRYYFAHLASIAVEPGASVTAGTTLGVMGETGNARQSECHTHFGISRPCPEKEWAIRRGEIDPKPFLDGWKAGENTSPAWAVVAALNENPGSCDFAQNSPNAAEA